MPCARPAAAAPAAAVIQPPGSITAAAAFTSLDAGAARALRMPSVIWQGPGRDQRWTDQVLEATLIARGCLAGPDRRLRHFVAAAPARAPQPGALAARTALCNSRHGRVRRPSSPVPAWLCPPCGCVAWQPPQMPPPLRPPKLGAIGASLSLRKNR